MVTDGSEYILFSIGKELGYSYFRYDRRFANWWDIDSIRYSDPSSLTTVSNFSGDSSNNNGFETNDFIRVEMINNPINETFELNVYYGYNNSDNNNPAMNVFIDKDYFEGGLNTELSLYLLSNSIDEEYNIISMSYTKQLTPMIEFEASIPAENDFLKDLSSVFNNNKPPPFVAALFT